jgi:hypothetical protein
MSNFDHARLFKRRVLVYLGRERLQRDGIEVLPFEEFAATLGSRL